MNKIESFNINIINSIFLFLFGQFDMILKVLLVIIGIDYISGVCSAIYQKRLNSKIGLKGIIKKIGYLLIVILTTLFDRMINDNSFAIRNLIIYFFISNEAISICENWSTLGLPLPKKIYEVFDKFKKE